LDNIGKLVRTNIVRNIKFVQNEHTSGLSKEAIDNARQFPSFWKPDLTIAHSIQADIFNHFPNLCNGTLKEKVRAWLGIRDKVMNSIRGHRNATQTAIQNSIVEGKIRRIAFCIYTSYY